MNTPTLRARTLRRAGAVRLSRCLAKLTVRPGASVLALTALVALGVVPAPVAHNQPQATVVAPAVTALPTLNVPAYMGIWHQVAWFPNRFQKQCVSDTTATYRQMPSGQVEVINLCRRQDGSPDPTGGIARPAGSVLRGEQLAPAQLEVSFLPPLLRWLPVWGAYWVLDRAAHGRTVVVGEPTREYLWVLARRPTLSEADETAIRSRLAQLGFVDLSRWQTHRHTGAATPPQQR